MKNETINGITVKVEAPAREGSEFSTTKSTTMKTFDILKSKHAAGGFILSITTEKGNTRFGEEKKKAIIKALQDSWTEAVYITEKGDVKRQLMNGSFELID